MPQPPLHVEVVELTSIRPAATVWVLVVDVLRATTTLLRALENGARAVLPVAGLEDARHLAETLGRDRVVLCGERDGLPPRGFDRGNSPLEMTPQNVRERTLVLTTTNGTAALEAARGSARVMTACFANRNALARWVASTADPGGLPEQVQICCAGRRGGSGEDDELFAAGLIHALQRESTSRERGVELGARASALLPQWSDLLEDEDRLAEALLATEAGAWLRGLGFEHDVRAAARSDDSSMLPHAREEHIAGRLRQVLRPLADDPRESDPRIGPAVAR